MFIITGVPLRSEALSREEEGEVLTFENLATLRLEKREQGILKQQGEACAEVNDFRSTRRILLSKIKTIWQWKVLFKIELDFVFPNLHHLNPLKIFQIYHSFSLEKPLKTSSRLVCATVKSSTSLPIPEAASNSPPTPPRP